MGLSAVRMDVLDMVLSSYVYPDLLDWSFYVRASGYQVLALVMGLAVGSDLVSRLYFPVRLARFSSTKKTVSIWFRSRDYHQRFVRHLKRI